MEVDNSSPTEPVPMSDDSVNALVIDQGSNDQLGSHDYETLANIEAEIKSMNAEQQVGAQESSLQMEVEETPETIVPDVDMSEIAGNTSMEMSNDNQPKFIITADPTGTFSLVPEKPALQKIAPATTTSTMQNIAPATQRQAMLIVQPSVGGQQHFLKISHPSSASIPKDQLQTLAQTIMSGQTPDGNVVLRAAPTTKPPNLAAKTTGTNTAKSTQPIASKKNLQQNKNVFTTKMIISNTPAQSNQQLLIATPAEAAGQTIKFVSNTASNVSMGSPTKTITFAQAQQMGLIQSSNKVQHILPSSGQKQAMVVNKVSQPITTQGSKVAVVSRSPAKILPAPPTKTVAGNKIIQPNTQKVIIRQSTMKNTGANNNPIIRLPANQTINPNQIHQVQIPGRQGVQYVRLVSTTSATGTGNVVTTGKNKTGTIQTVGVTQKVGTQQVVKVVPLNTGNQTLRTVAPKTTGTQRILIPAATPVVQPKTNTITIPASALSQLTSGQAVLSTAGNVGNIVVLPPQYLQQAEDVKPKLQPVTSTAVNNSQNSSSTMASSSFTESRQSRSTSNADTNGIRPRKPCNCTKSQCLKLYCDCFANGEFCHMCNCNNCSNNLGNEEERHRAIRSCLERNPNAFRPKIGKARETGDDIRRHNKGCNCKRSGCLKNYCECYEAKIPCSNNCKCIGCRNVEEPDLSKKSLNDLADAAEVRTAQLSIGKSKIQPSSDITFRPPATSNAGARQPFNFLTDKVVEMTCQCLMAQAEEAEKNMLNEEMSEKLIIEEFGRCLKEIIDSASKADTV
ncbi:protein lin-54 homolog isoform X1 [Trichogramma pretiosum]|uniref:protein lin-54 homolog isoform X1 n=1 Tax=Trichogramma pretiosum TaxID=7493 RepID=UPI0006C94B14|nr:protein lin-54 homolog isoform X1 [Trichogramma pretiosum]XP_014224288.1 protein lin-54 homolog isoform X1 [Trichogramma pretiosum]